MSEVTVYMHPQVWAETSLWNRIKTRLSYSVVLDRRCPPNRVYMGAEPQKGRLLNPPNGKYGKIKAGRNIA